MRHCHAEALTASCLPNFRAESCLSVPAGVEDSGLPWPAASRVTGNPASTSASKRSDCLLNAKMLSVPALSWVE